MKSLEDLRKLRDEAKKNMNMRHIKGGIRIQVGMGTCGIAAGAGLALKRLMYEIEENNLKNIFITQVGCMGECAFEPIVEVIEENGSHSIYCQVSERMVDEIVEEHLMGGRPIEKYLLSARKR